MNFKTAVLPLFLAATPAFVHFPATSKAVDARANVQTQVVGAQNPAQASLASDERAQLQRADRASSTLGAKRGGEMSNHELTIGLIIVGVVLLLILL